MISAKYLINFVTIIKAITIFTLFLISIKCNKPDLNDKIRNFLFLHTNPGKTITFFFFICSLHLAESRWTCIVECGNWERISEKEGLVLNKLSSYQTPYIRIQSEIYRVGLKGDIVMLTFTWHSFWQGMSASGNISVNMATTIRQIAPSAIMDMRMLSIFSFIVIGLDWKAIC